MALLEVKNLSVGINNSGPKAAARIFLPAVDNISFEIGEGEIVGLAGESGCGKSLTALSIPRLLPPAAEITGGEIVFDGLPLSHLSETELCRIRGKDISMIFQEPRQSLNPLMRIGSQIIETLELHGMGGKTGKTGNKKEAARAMIEKLGLGDPEKILRSYPHQLSGGMCQRVMIAIAAICQPKLLIADEPSTALDAAIQDQILSLLGEINSSFGTAVLFISHDLSVVRRFCRRFLVMYAGKIVEEGPAEKVFSEAAHPYTKALIGAIPGKAQRGKKLANIPGRVPSIEDRLPGCPFTPRCPQADENCPRSFPGEKNLGGGHRSYCFRIGERHD